MKSAAFALMLIAGLCGCSGGQVTREEAKVAADGYFVESAKKDGQEVGNFLPAQIEDTAEGWQFRYRMRGNQLRAYGIFVRRSGEMDINLTPDA